MLTGWITKNDWKKVNILIFTRHLAICLPMASQLFFWCLSFQWPNFWIWWIFEGNVPHSGLPFLSWMTNLYVLRTKPFVGCPAVHHSFLCTLNLLGKKRLQRHRSMKMEGTSAEHLVQVLLRAGSWATAGCLRLCAVMFSTSPKTREFTSLINFRALFFFLYSNLCHYLSLWHWTPMSNVGDVVFTPLMKYLYMSKILLSLLFFSLNSFSSFSLFLHIKCFSTLTILVAWLLWNIV